MTKTECILEFMKAIAPVIVKEGNDLTQRIVHAGSDPSDCTINGEDILHAHAQCALEWAEAFADKAEILL